MSTVYSNHLLNISLSSPLSYFFYDTLPQVLTPLHIVHPFHLCVFAFFNFTKRNLNLSNKYPYLSFSSNRSPPCFFLSLLKHWRAT